MSASLKKLWNDYGIGAIVVFIIVMYVLSMLYKYFAAKGGYGMERMSQNGNSAYGGGKNNSHPKLIIS